MIIASGDVPCPEFRRDCLDLQSGKVESVTFNGYRFTVYDANPGYDAAELLPLKDGLRWLLISPIHMEPHASLP